MLHLENARCEVVTLVFFLNINNFPLPPLALPFSVYKMVSKQIPHLALPPTPKPKRTGGGYKLPLTPIKKVKKGPVATRLPAAALAPSRRRAPLGRKKARFSAIIKKTCHFKEEKEEVQAKLQAVDDCDIMEPERRVESTILKKLKKNPLNKPVKSSFKDLFSSRASAVKKRLVKQKLQGSPIISPLHENQYFNRLELVAVDMDTD
eukprot:GHVT01050146.1.p1 GENE.GHVT01050146.1~~GHVT01050146.1.p1  ORF type:complete len:206 (+),score=34.29 GHVT01050146.1:85-702(+)